MLGTAVPTWAHGRDQVGAKRVRARRGRADRDRGERWGGDAPRQRRCLRHRRPETRRKRRFARAPLTLEPRARDHLPFANGVGETCTKGPPTKPMTSRGGEV